MHFLHTKVTRIPQLTAEDRCLNLMPLCYYAGFYTLLTALAAGGSIAWPQSLDPDAFFAALEVFRPSWYAATPTVHSAIVAHAARYADLIAGTRCDSFDPRRRN